MGIPWDSKLTMLEKMMIHHEGLRLKPYLDTVGVMTIGVGRNLSSNGISNDEALYMLRRDLAGFEAALENQFQFYKQLSKLRQWVLISMAFNLGMKGLLGFKNMLSFMSLGNYHGASVEMLNSKWAKQVGQRAHDLAHLMREDDIPKEMAHLFHGFGDERDPLAP